MKRIFKFLTVILLFLIVSATSSFAYVIAPYGRMFVRHGGIGFVNVPNNFTAYSEPDINSEVLAQIDVKELANSNVVDAFERLNDIVVFYSPAKKEENSLIYIPVEEKLDCGWFKIVLSQETGQTGWINVSNDRYMRHKTFYNHYGCKNGVFLMREIKDIQKGLYYAPYETAKIMYGFTVAKHLKLVMIKGNWMMVIATEYDGQVKMGWIRWRTNDGKLLIFPIIK